MGGRIVTQCVGSKSAQMELKLDRQNLRGSKKAHTLNFYTCSGRFPAMTTIKGIRPFAVDFFTLFDDL